MSPPSYRELVRSYLDLRWQLDPVAATAAGVGVHDHRLGRFSRPDIREAIAALKAMASAFEEAEVDSRDDEVDQTAVLNEIRVWVARLEREKPHELNPEFHLGHVLNGWYMLLVRQDQPLEHRGRALAGRLADTPRFLDDARATLQRPSPVFTETAIRVARGGIQMLREAVPAFAALLPTITRNELLDVLEPARKSLDDFLAFLAGELADRSDGNFAIGREALDFRLHYEHALRETAPEVERYGAQLLAETELELERLAQGLSPGTSWRELVRRLRRDHPVRDQLVGRYASAMKAAQEFVMARQLVTIPDGALDVVGTPEWMAPLIPFAAYDPPGAFAASQRGLFYVTAAQPGQDGNGHCEHEIACTALHEGYPGHHLQFLVAHRQSSPVRRVVSSPLTVEGWALYCEELMAEQGFLASAEERFFQRVHLLWRALRIVLDVQLHTGTIDFESAVARMVETLGLPRGAAESEVRRYCGWPGYQLCYAMGRRELLRLREDRMAREGSSFDLRRFHDELLSYGGLPVALIRWGMGLDG